jgi:hypothetical protein
MLKVSVSYLEKQKSFIPKKKYFFGRSQYQNKTALFTDSIFREGFGFSCTILQSHLLILKIINISSLLHVQGSSVDSISRASNIESNDSQNLGLEDYNNISDGIFPNFTSPSIKITLG